MRKRLNLKRGQLNIKQVTNKSVIIMARKTAGQSNFVSFDIGTEYEGYYIGSTDKDQGPNLSRIHNFVRKDGEPFSVWGSASLDLIFCGDIGKELESSKPHVPLGAYCWVKREEDMVQNAQGVKYRQPMKKFTVDFDDEDFADGYEKPGVGGSRPAQSPVNAPAPEAENEIPKAVAEAAEPRVAKGQAPVAAEEDDDDLPF